MSRQKHLMFGVSGLLLVLNYWLVVVRPRRCAPGELCHVDSPVMRFNRRLWIASIVVYVVGAVITYGWPLLFRGI